MPRRCAGGVLMPSAASLLTVPRRFLVFLSAFTLSFLHFCVFCFSPVQDGVRIGKQRGKQNSSHMVTVSLLPVPLFLLFLLWTMQRRNKRSNHQSSIHLFFFSPSLGCCRSPGIAALAPFLSVSEVRKTSSCKLSHQIRGN